MKLHGFDYLLSNVSMIGGIRGKSFGRKIGRQ